MALTSDFGFTMRPSRRELVVVVADDPSVRSAVVTRLQEDGYSVLDSASPEEATAMLVVTHASLLVVATKRIEALRLERAIPVIFLGAAPASYASLNASRVTVAPAIEQIADAVAASLVAAQRPAG